MLASHLLSADLAPRVRERIAAARELPSIVAPTTPAPAAALFPAEPGEPVQLVAYLKTPRGLVELD